MSQEEQQKIVLKYRSLREEIEMLYSKLGAIDGDRSEHEYVWIFFFRFEKLEEVSIELTGS